MYPAETATDACEICHQSTGQCLEHCQSQILRLLAKFHDSQGNSIDLETMEHLINLFGYAESSLSFPESLKDYPLAYRIATGARRQVQRQNPGLSEFEVPCEDVEKIRNFLKAAEHIHAQVRAINFPLTRQG